MKKTSDLRLTASCWDVSTSSLICSFGPTKDDHLIQLKRWHSATSPLGQDLSKALEQIASWDAPCPIPDLDCDRVLDLHYFSDTKTICLVLVGGDIIIVKEEPLDGDDKIEIVGSVDVGISAAAWSPDEELLAIITNASTLLFMSRDLENVVDITFTEDDLKASKHVSVGWGKAETQFKGKGAKALRDPTIPESIDEGKPSPHEDRTSVITWRGDGAYLAVNSIHAASRRVIRVFSREGLLDGISEPVDGLEAALSWRPAGNLIAGVQRFENHADIVFFERNGLRHGNFSLRLDNAITDDWVSKINLRWNVDSSVLAVCYLDRIQLWTMGNYHYYMKQEILLSPTTKFQRPADCVWHPEQPLLFAIYDTGWKSSLTCGTITDCHAEGIQRLQNTYCAAIGPISPPNDYGIVAVIDGGRLISSLNSVWVLITFQERLNCLLYELQIFHLQWHYMKSPLNSTSMMSPYTAMTRPYQR